MIRHPYLQPARKLILTFTLIGIILIVVACLPQENSFEGEELPYESIERKVTSGTGELYNNRSPGLIVITDLAEVDRLGKIVTNESKEQITGTDFNTQFVLVVFQGLQTTYHEEITVTRVQYHDNQIEVRFRTGSGNRGDMLTSPYHVVKVNKADVWAWNEPFRISLIMDGSVIFSKTQLVKGYTLIEGKAPPTITPRKINPSPTKTPRFTRTP